jgi:hypothetical protein
MYKKHYVVMATLKDGRLSHDKFEADEHQMCNELVFELAHNKEVKKITKLTVEKYSIEG